MTSEKMELRSIGTVIATRELSLPDERKVIVRIGMPALFSEGRDYYCPFQITGIGDERIRYIGGVDAVQALLLTFKTIGVLLSVSDEAKAGFLTWLDVKDFGFPT